jgi:hypothetical protein
MMLITFAELAIAVQILSFVEMAANCVIYVRRLPGMKEALFGAKKVSESTVKTIAAAVMQNDLVVHHM